MVEGFVLEETTAGDEMTVMPPSQVDEILISAGGENVTIPSPISAPHVALGEEDAENAVTQIEADVDDMPALEPILRSSPENETPSAPVEELIPDTGKPNVIPLAFYDNAQTVPNSEAGKECVVEEETERPLDEEYIAESLKMIDVFKQQLQTTVLRSGPPFPVGKGSPFDQILAFCVRICREGFDAGYKQLAYFFQENLFGVFNKLLTDDNTSSWGQDFQSNMFRRCEQVIRLIAMKIGEDITGLLDLLTLLLNPTSRFVICNASKPSETFPMVILPHSTRSNFGTFSSSISNSDLRKDGDSTKEEDVIPADVYGRCFSNRDCKGYLVDWINSFGRENGFENLRKRIVNPPADKPLTITLLVQMLKPFGACAEFLTKRTVETYFLEIFRKVPEFLQSMSDEDFKKESGKQDGKTDPVTNVLRSLKSLVKILPDHTTTVNQVIETTRLSAIMKFLKVANFNGKMHALNEIHKIIQNLIYANRPFGSDDDKAVLDADKVASWLQQNGVLTLILADNMHQPQFVEKLEKIIRFMIKEKSLTIKDLDDLWMAQESGKHEAIVKNVHDLLTKLAWDFSPEQLDHLFCRFQESWVSASRRQREKLLELIRRLAEDDRGGVMADKVLEVLWNLCHNDELPAEIMEQALAAHLKILDYTFTHDRETLKMGWLRKCVEEIKSNVWAVPALRHIRNICDQFPEGTGTSTIGMNKNILMTRVDIVKKLESDLKVVDTVISSLEQYLYQVRGVMRHALTSDFDPATQDLLGSKYPHAIQVEERLNFLYYVIKYSQEALMEPQKLWSCLVENPVVADDRDLCFKWFTRLMHCETDPEIRQEKIKSFFEQHVLTLEPSVLTESGIHCFSKFLTFVNTNEGKIEIKRNQHCLKQLNDLVGGDYLWQIILTCNPEISQMGIDLFRDLYGFPSVALQNNIIDLHQDVIEAQCMLRLRSICDTLTEIKNDEAYRSKINQDTNKAVRILKVVTEYVQQYDKDHRVERVRPSLARSTLGQGFHVQLKNPVNNTTDVLEIPVHTNETIGDLRRTFHVKFNLAASVKLEIMYGNELILPVQDRCLITEIINDPNRTEKQSFSIKLATNFSGGHLISDGANVSSPDTSNDVSPADTPQDVAEDVSYEMEKSLPGVWLSQNSDKMQFLNRLADLGSRLGSERLVNAARELLDILPPDERVIRTLREAAEGKIELKSCFPQGSPSEMLYHLQVLLSILLPSRASQLDDASIRLYQFVVEQNLPDFVFHMLVQNSFLRDADRTTKERVYSCVMRLSKLIFYVQWFIGYSVYDALSHRSANNNTGFPVNGEMSKRGYPEDVLIMLAAMRVDQHNVMSTDLGMVEVADVVCRRWKDGIVTLPTLVVLRALRRIAWVGASGSLDCLQSAEELDQDFMEKGGELSSADVAFVDDAIDCLFLCFPLTESAIDNVIRNPDWLNFFSDLLVICREPEIRKKARQRFGLLLHNCLRNPSHVASIVQYFFTMIHEENLDQPEIYEELFYFVASLLQPFNYVTRPLIGVDDMLNKEMQWLLTCKHDCLDQNLPSVHDTVLEGHLRLIRALVLTLSPQGKVALRTSNDSPPLIKELLEQFLFPASRLLYDVTSKENSAPSRTGSGDGGYGSSPSSPSGDLFDDPDALLDMPVQARPICQTTASVTAAFEVIIALCVGSTENLTLLYTTLTALFYSGEEVNIIEWDYSPAIGPRKTDGFVGLKNAGATCYMNSVLQQLYMTPSVRNGILQMKDVLPHYSEEEEERGEGDAKRMVGPVISTEAVVPVEEAAAPASDYNSTLIKQLQIIFSHLACSKLQFYTPKGFWKNFRLGSEPVNLREQHDALEFYISVLDTVDEGLKSKKKGTLMTEILGGTFADQKICRDCPHRYSREEPFTSISLDIRNYHTMQDAMEHYVKGDLLEGANAYFCEKCQRKVDTVKRLCIKRLPPMLTIQLKRFDYDWEREQSIKFNDYFEFPRQIDMEPYTAAGLAEVEGHIIPDYDEIPVQESISPSGSVKKQKPVVTQYRLVGIVVHSGQAAGGHYYSYILDRDGDPKWYRFDDGDVTECKMDDDEEMKTQCFGGEQPQKRWWSAYLIFYERMDVPSNGLAGRGKGAHGRIRMMSESIGSQVVYMIPQSLRRSILKQNLKFAHIRSQFIPEYFTFLKKLLSMCVNHLTSMWTAAAGAREQSAGKENSDMEYGALAVMRLIGKFAFDTGFRTKRTLRGTAGEWAENFCKLLQHFANARKFFVLELVLKYPKRLMEFLIECTQTDVRSSFLRMLQTAAFYGREDIMSLQTVKNLNERTGLQLPEEEMSLEKLIFRAVMDLPRSRREFNDNSRNLGNFLMFFTSCLQSPDIAQKLLLIRMGLPELLIKLVGDDSGSSIFSKYNHHTDQVVRLFQIVAHLVLLMDLSDSYQANQANIEHQRPRQPFPTTQHLEHGHIRVKASTELCNAFSLSSAVLKRIFDDCNIFESPFNQMLKWIAWENAHVSARIGKLLLSHLASVYQQDYHRMLDFTFEYLQLEDSWTVSRLDQIFFGTDPGNNESFLTIMNRFKVSAPRKAYFCLRFLLNLMGQPGTAGTTLRDWMEADWNERSQSFRQCYQEMCAWLQKEIHPPLRNSQTGYFGNTTYNSFNWNSHQITTNEQATGNGLERTDSARNLLCKALLQLGMNGDPYGQGEEGNGADDEEDPEEEYGHYGGGLVMGDVGLVQSNSFETSEVISSSDIDGAVDQSSEGNGNTIDGMDIYGPAPRKSHAHERRNGVAPDQIREKLVSGGIINQRSNNIEVITNIIGNIQLNERKNFSSGHGDHADSYRPGTPVGQEVAEAEVHERRDLMD